MRIENELKLDFKDVLIKPERSQVNSRSQVCLTANYRFMNGYNWSGVPIIAANMDGVGTFAMSEALSKHGLMTCLNKSYSVEDWSREQDCWETNNSILSTGITPSDMTRTIEIVNKFGSGIQFICIDVANGYTDAFVSAIKKYRSFFPEKTIIAGNVVCGVMTAEVIRAGADIVKVGIGPGCFAAGTIVNTSSGQKPIEEITIGDEVFTHKNRKRKVLNTFTHEGKDIFIEINGIKATPNHEFYVVHKRHESILNDDNIHDYAEWIPAEEITKDHFLLELR